MIKNYHAISHGLHGLGDLEYHFGSHLLMAAMGNIARTSIIDSYDYLFVFLVVPLLSVSVIAVSEEFYPSQDVSDFLKKLYMYLLVFLGTGVMLPLSVPEIFALWPSFFQSESYTVSLILLLCLISLLTKDVECGLGVTGRLIFLSGILVVIVLYTTAAKISTGFVALGLIDAWALLSRERLFSPLWTGRWIILIVSAAGFLLLFSQINPTMSDANLDVFEFVRDYVSLPAPVWLKLPFFIVVHFFFPLLALLVCWQKYRQHAMAEIPGWWILGLAGSLVLGAGVILLLFVQGGSGYYFSNISMFVALPLVLSIPQLYEEAIKKHWTIIKPLAIATLVIHGAPAIGYGIYKYVSEMGTTPERNTYVPYLDSLRQIAETDPGSPALVHIPRSEKYWEKMYSMPLDLNACRALTYTIPAISEHPALYSWPTEECYSYLCGERFHSNGLCEASDHIYSRRELIEEAHNLGYNRVYLVTANDIEILE